MEASSLCQRLTAGVALLAAGATASPAAPRQFRSTPEVRQVVTFRFQPGRARDAVHAFEQLLAPVYRETAAIVRFRAYREAESPEPLDLIVVTTVRGLAGMDELNRQLRERPAAGDAYERLSQMSDGHHDAFVEMVDELRFGDADAARLLVFDWLQVAPGGRANYERLLQIHSTPWERSLGKVRSSETGRCLVCDGWDYLRILGFDSLGDFHDHLIAARTQSWATPMDELRGPRRRLIVRPVEALRIR
jgi:hypothetical protein